MHSRFATRTLFFEKNRSDDALSIRVDTDFHLMTPEARRHSRQMATLLRPATARLNREFKRILQDRGYARNAIRAALAITPAAAAACRTHGEFIERVEYNGRRLAKLNVGPVEAHETLREFSSLIEPILAGRFQPAREQIELATRLTLNQAYYQVREAETQALFGIYQAEVEARDQDDFLLRLVRVLTAALRARSGRIVEMEETLAPWLGKPRYIERGGARESLIADARMRGRYASYWSYPLGGHLIAQFGFAVKYPWLPRELALLDAAAERVRAAAERRRLESENRRLEEQARRAEEEERRRIGRELHDEAGQSLLLLRLQLEMMERDAPPAFCTKLAGARGIAEMAIMEIRRIVVALSPALLERLGLAAALRHLSARFAKMHSASVALRIPRRIPPLPRAVEEVIYRVAQECLLNIAKHSCASSVKLSLRIANSQISLSVSDDGSGFSGESASRKPHSFGLKGMRERAALLSGKLKIVSAPNKGVTVKLELPLAGTPRKSNGKKSRITD
jgi:signal transduction histidine kinase